MRMPSWSVQVQGWSASAGLTYSGERFEQNFADFRQKYGISDMYSGGFYPYDTLEEYWAWWSQANLYQPVRHHTRQAISGAAGS